MEQTSNVSHGVKWGVIAGFAYTIFLLWRYKFGADNPIILTVSAALGFIVVLILLLVCGITRKKSLGGFIEFKDAFQTMFVCVLIFELFYNLFTYIYLKYIDPAFFDKMKNSIETMLEKANMEQSKIDEQLEKMDIDKTKKTGFNNIILSYAFSVIISSIFALIFALIIKKKKDPFTNNQEKSFSDQPS